MHDPCNEKRLSFQLEEGEDVLPFDLETYEMELREQNLAKMKSIWQLRAATDKANYEAQHQARLAAIARQEVGASDFAFNPAWVSRDVRSLR
jgi:hypothetical protein